MLMKIAEFEKLFRLAAGLDEDVERLLPEIAGALVVAYARVLKELDPALKNPQTQHHERAERVFNLLL
jgi:hypothetical protein